MNTQGINNISSSNNNNNNTNNRNRVEENKVQHQSNNHGAAATLSPTSVAQSQNQGAHGTGANQGGGESAQQAAHHHQADNVRRPGATSLLQEGGRHNQNQHHGIMYNLASESGDDALENMPIHAHNETSNPHHHNRNEVAGHGVVNRLTSRDFDDDGGGGGSRNDGTGSGRFDQEGDGMEQPQGKNLQSIIFNLKRKAEAEQDIKRLEKELKKRIVKRDLTENDAEIVIHKKKLVVVRRSLFILDVNTKIRQFFLYLTEWIWFERFVMFLIFCNSMFLASYDYSDRDDKSTRNGVLNTGGRVFTVLFTVEAVCKILAYGFVFHRRAYMRNGWNWLDLLVVIVGWIEIVPQIPNFRGIRTFRVLRPLRAINSISNLKNQVESLIKSLGQLVNVLLFLLFLFLIFGILGIQIYEGQFYQRCRLTEEPLADGTWPVAPDIDRLCSKNDDSGWFKCPEPYFCGAPQDFDLGLENEHLEQAPYMNFGITTFDNIGVGMLTIFQVITLEGWSDIMYMMMDSGSPILAGIFFLMLVFLGAFFLLNVILVVIISNYSETKNAQKNNNGKGHLDDGDSKHNTSTSSIKPASSSPLPSLPAPSAKDGGEIFNQTLPLSTARRDLEQSELPPIYVQDQEGVGLPDGNNHDLNETSRLRKQANQSSLSESVQPINQKAHSSHLTPHGFNEKSQLNSIDQFHNNNSQSLKHIAELSSNQSPCPTNRKSSLPQIDRPKNSTPIFEIDEVISKEGRGKVIPDEDLDNIIEAKNPRDEQSNPNSKLASNLMSPKIKIHNNDGTKMSNSMIHEMSVSQKTQDAKSPKRRNRKRMCKEIQYKIQNFFLAICMNKLFALSILILITINTIILALDQYPLDKDREEIFDQINTVLTWCFFLEMVIKIIGLGVHHYVRDKVNVFDAIVVLLTVAENITDLVLTAQGLSQKGSVSGFRAIRLFRFFKVARTMKSFQIMIEKIAISLKDIASFSVLLFLFLFTFTLLGLELFSNQVKFDKNGQVDLVNGTSQRPNFDDFVQGFVTIFMVLIGDNWPQYMYRHMIALGPASSIFFVILQIFGKYVLLNLFLAILLENFEEIEISEHEHGTQNTQGSQDGATQGGEKQEIRHLKEESIVQILKGGISTMFRRQQAQAVMPTNEDSQKQALVNADAGQNSSSININENINGGNSNKNGSTVGNGAALGEDRGTTDARDQAKDIKLVERYSSKKMEKTQILLDAAIGDVDEMAIQDERQQQLNKHRYYHSDSDKNLFDPEDSQNIALIRESQVRRMEEDLTVKRVFSITVGQEVIESIEREQERTFKEGGQGNIDLKLKQLKMRDKQSSDSAFNAALNELGSSIANLNEKTPATQKERDNKTINSSMIKDGQIGAKDTPSQSMPPPPKKKNLNFMETVIQPHKERSQAATDVKLIGNSLIFLSPSNPFRLLVKKIVLHPYFDPFIILIIIISTVLMAIDNPLNDPEGPMSTVLNQIDTVITAIFILESVLKIIHYGFLFNGKQSYLRVSWNIMDFIIVVFSVISIIFSNLNIQFIKVIRMLRVLRPLRMISRNEGLKIAVVSLINAVPSIINALVIALLFFLLFAIFGTTYFKGKFYYCLTDNIEDIVDISLIESKWDCLQYGGEWINHIVNFDNVLQSMAALFVLSSTEGWGDIMFQGVDSTDIDYNPKENHQVAWAFFFMCFMIVGSLFMLNLFVSIVVNTYYGEKEKLYRNDLLSKYQKIWLQVQNLCLQEEPEKQLSVSGNKFQRICQNLARDNSWFDYFILICILLNTIIMAINWYGCPPDLLDALEYTNYFFTAAFTIEAFFKLVAFNPRGYFSQGWNIFDFIIVIISYVTLIIGLVTSSDIGPKQATIARAFRIGRIFRLITKAKFLRVIFNTIIYTIPSLANVGALMMLLLFIFSILGVQIFATVKLQENLNEHANFQNFGIALLTLLRLQTGEGWNEIMKDLARQRDVYFDCDDTPDFKSIQRNDGQPNGCGTSFSYMFFVLFQLIVSIIFLNLFVAVILNGFTNSNEEEGFEVFKNNLANFKRVWKKFDPEATGFINVDAMSDLVQTLETETNFITTSLSEPKLIRNFIAHLQVPSYFSFTKYYYQDVLTVLCKKYISHKYVLEYLKNMEIQDDIEKVQAEKNYRERAFEDEISDIQAKSMNEKIQLVEENLKHATKYKKRMYLHVDKFIEEIEEEIDGVKVSRTEEKIYDSSYIIWVPYIQMRMKPWLKRFKERKRQAEQDRQNVEDELANITTHRNGAITQRAGDLIIETGSQLVPNMGTRSRRNGEIEEGYHGQHNRQESLRNFQSAQSLNDEEMANLAKNVKGQTTGEVGGTLFLGIDDNLDNSRLDQSRTQVNLVQTGYGASTPQNLGIGTQRTQQVQGLNIQQQSQIRSSLQRGH